MSALRSQQLVDLDALNARIRDLVATDPKRAAREAAEVMRAAEELGDPLAQAQALHTQALCQMELRDMERGLAVVELAVGQYARIPDLQGYAEAHLLRAKLALGHNDTDTALESCEKIIGTAEDSLPTAVLADALLTKATLCFRQGRYPEATSSLQHSGEVRLLLGDKVGHAKCLNNTGLIYEATGEYAHALNSFMRCLEFLRTNDLTMDVLLSACLVNIGKVYRELGDSDNAFESLTRGVEIAEQARHANVLGVYVTLVAATSELGLIYRERGHLSDALDAFHRALNMTRSQNMRDEKQAQGGSTLHEEAELLDNIGQTCGLIGDVQKGMCALNEALQLAEEAGEISTQCSVLTHLSTLLIELGDYDQALPLLRRALEVAEVAGVRRPALEAHEQLAHCLVHTGQFQEAAAHFALVTQGQREIFRVDNERKLRNLAGQLELEKARNQADVYRQLNDVSQKARQEAEAEVFARTAELEQAQLETVNRLGLAAEYRDDKTGMHTYRVGNISALLAQTMGLPAAQVELLRLAARLHDVGKIGVPDAILLKPGKFTPEEFNIMKHHTSIGARVLNGGRSDLMQLAEQIALTHHERWDGRGYPGGLSGEDIPIAGRLVAVADVWDALTTERPYKDAWSVEAALAEIQAQSGKQFDPAVVAAFLKLASEGGLQNLNSMSTFKDDLNMTSSFAPGTGRPSPDHPDTGTLGEHEAGQTGIKQAEEEVPQTGTHPLDDVMVEIDSLIEESWQARYQGPDALIGPSQRALDLAQKHGYTHGLGFAYRNLALAHIYQNRFEEAMEYLTKASVFADQLVNILLKRDCAVQLGLVYNRLLDSERALKYSLESLTLSKALEDRAGEARALANLGLVYKTLEGQQDKALAAMEEARRIQEDMLNLENVAVFTGNIAEVLLEMGKLDEAVLEGKKAISLAEAAENLVVHIQSMTTVARAYEALGQWAQARELYQISWDKISPLSGQLAEMAAWTALYFARGLLNHGEHQAGEALLDVTLGLASQHDFKRISERVHRDYADLYRKRGELELALTHQDQAHFLEVEIFRMENSQRALALSIEFQSERSRVEAESYKNRMVELASTNVALEKANLEKSALLIALEEQSKILERQLREDGLTGVYNRRYIEERLQTEFAKHRTSDSSLSILMIDIDHFKLVNDNFSHQVGDEVLRRVAQIFRATCRPYDLVGRYGGEEFLIVLPASTATQGVSIAERIRKNVEEYPWHEIHPRLSVTLSIGLCARTDLDNHERMLSLADEKLYEAKHAGRNHVMS